MVGPFPLSPSLSPFYSQRPCFNCSWRPTTLYYYLWNLPNFIEKENSPRKATCMEALSSSLGHLSMADRILGIQCYCRGWSVNFTQQPRSITWKPRGAGGRWKTNCDRRNNDKQTKTCSPTVGTEVNSPPHTWGINCDLTTLIFILLFHFLANGKKKLLFLSANPCPCAHMSESNKRTPLVVHSWLTISFLALFSPHPQ